MKYFGCVYLLTVFLEVLSDTGIVLNAVHTPDGELTLAAAMVFLTSQVM